MFSTNKYNFGCYLRLIIKSLKHRRTSTFAVTKLKQTHRNLNLPNLLQWSFWPLSKPTEGQGQNFKTLRRPMLLNLLLTLLKSFTSRLKWVGPKEKNGPSSKNSKSPRPNFESSSSFFFKDSR